jgi:hypothetical protein
VLLTLCVGFLSIAVTGRRQALHDLMAGTLVTRSRARPPLEVARKPQSDACETEIDRALHSAVWMSRQLPLAQRSGVADIQARIQELRPYARSFSTGSRDLFVLGQIASVYLPTSIEACLAVPGGPANPVLLQGEKTALQELQDQLDLMRETLDDIRDTVLWRSSERLLVHGRFLRESFGRPPAEPGLLPRLD